MSDQRTSLEIIAPSVEEAIGKGLEELGLPEEAVEVEVLDAGSRGLFGLGFRQARVRLTIKAASGRPAAPAVNAPAPDAPPAPPAPVVAEPLASEPMTPAISVEPLAEAEMEAEADFDLEASPAPASRRAPTLEPGEDAEYLLRVARETVDELLSKMKVQAKVTARFGEPDDDRDRAPLLVEVRGNDLSILIGPKAETLNALQYIAGLIVGKEVGHTLPLIVDVEGYRSRRTQQIRQLARRMAEQAIRTGRRQVLEPMPANERRLIHIELRDHPKVKTESVGEEPRRKVTIVPK